MYGPNCQPDQLFCMTHRLFFDGWEGCPECERDYTESRDDYLTNEEADARTER